MKYLRPLVYGLDVEPVVAELDAHPELWDKYRLRTAGYAPAHNAVSDVWIRYRDFREFELLRDHPPLHVLDTQGDVSKIGPLPNHEASAVAKFVSEPHESVWYEAIDVLPSLRTLIFELMRHFEVERLGGVLITRIPPGAEVKPHEDHGWHAHFFEKLAVQLRSAPGQTFYYADGSFECEPGTVYTFMNQAAHGVNNPTEHERITLIMSVRRDQRRPPLWQSE